MEGNNTIDANTICDAVECKDKDQIKNEPMFAEDDPPYSCDARAGTSIVHAIAKAIYAEVFLQTDDKINLKTESLVKVLNESKVALGGPASHPLAFSGVTGSVEGRGGHKYTLEIEIKNSPDGHIGDIAVVDLGKFVAGYSENSLHTMFIEDEDYMSYSVVLRNSWGSNNQTINTTVSHAGFIDQFAVQVKNFIWKSDKGDIELCGNVCNEWTELEEWPEEYTEDGI
jgi:hypothetical protein